MARKKKQTPVDDGRVEVVARTDFRQGGVQRAAGETVTVRSRQVEWLRSQGVIK